MRTPHRTPRRHGKLSKRSGGSRFSHLLRSGYKVGRAIAPKVLNYLRKRGQAAAGRLAQAARKRIRAHMGYGPKALSTAAAAGQHNNMTTTKLKIVLNPPKKLFKSLGKWDLRWSQQGSNSLISYEGMQTASEAISMFTTQYFVTTQALAAQSRDSPNFFPGALFDMNPYQAITGGPATNPFNAGNNNPLPDYIHVHDVESDWLITNFHSVSCWVDFLVFTPKTNSPNNTITAWYDAVQKKSMGIAQEVPQQDPKTYTAVSGRPYFAVPSYSVRDGVLGSTIHYGMDPYAEKEFNKFYRTIGAKKFVLNPGDTYKIATKLEINKTISKGYVQTLSEQLNYYIKDTSVQVMIIVRPAPVVATSVSDNTQKNITTGQAHIGWVCNNKVNISSLGASRLEYDRGFTGVPALYAVGTATDAQITDTDAVAAPAAAV